MSWRIAVVRALGAMAEMTPYVTGTRTNLAAFRLMSLTFEIEGSKCSGFVCSEILENIFMAKVAELRDESNRSIHPSSEPVPADHHKISLPR